MLKKMIKPLFSFDTKDLHIHSLIMVRHYLIDFGLSICFVIAFPALLFSAFRALDVGWQPVLFMHILIALFFISIWFLKNQMSYKIKGLAIASICFLLGVGGLLTWGLIGMGATLCIIFCITTGMFFGPKYGYISTILSVGIMAAIAFGFINHWLTYSFSIEEYSLSVSAWSLSILGVGFLSSLVTLSFHHLLDLLFNSINEMKKTTSDLQITNDQLKKEIVLRKQSDEALIENKKLYVDFLNKLPDMIYEAQIFKTDVSPSERQNILNLISTLKNTESNDLQNAVERIVPQISRFIDSRITFGNTAMISSLGYSFYELQKLKIKDLLSKKDHVTATENTLNLLSNHTQTASEYELIKKSGKRILVSVSLTVETNAYPFTIRCVMKDISRQRALELNLYKSQRRESIGTLAGGIAHDFRNILSAILGYAEMTKMTKLHPNHPAISNIDQIITASKRADSLIEHILTFSKQSEQKREAIEIGPVIEEAIAFIKASLPSTIEIKEHIYKGSEKILADPTQIYQIMINLCTNAAHAMKTSGGILVISFEKKTLSNEFSLQYPDLHPGTYLELTVKDNGHGIPKDIIESIFDPYFTTKEKSEGTGLGLAVVHGIVKNHKGEIMVQSVPGKGATFTIYFPIILTEKKIETETTEFLPTGRESILMVDDDPVITDLGKNMLTFLGYQVTTLNSSPEVVSVIESNPNQFDLVITDLIMPNISGIQLSEKIKQISHIPVILCTGNGHKKSTSEEELYQAGIYDIIVKPLFLKNIAHTVRNVLDRNIILSHTDN